MYGFRKGRGTQDALHVDVNTAKQALTTRQRSLFCMLDIKSAYDCVNINKLVDELLRWEIPPQIVRAVYELFRERHLAVTLDASTVIHRTTWVGLPQGSPLSPICFNIFINNAIRTTAAIPRLIVVNYADDVSLIAKGTDIEQIGSTVQDGISCFSNLIDDLGLALSPQKCKALMQIATDGSKSGENVGAGLVTNFGIHPTHYKLPKVASVFKAELFALQCALEIISTQPQSKYLIMSDSKSSLMYLQNNKVVSAMGEMWFRIRKCIANLSDLGYEIVLLWVPAYKGITLNESADTAAKYAAEHGTLNTAELSKFDFYFPSKRNALHEWQHQWSTGSKGMISFLKSKIIHGS
ncbi:uncharacterized protein LOC129753460 [Uranotaenia lowii]|uniref:uncharacterized protein LOC129753460 n=1 Tax=Uranotaenia lowii TaxID=190385 RepID=UPI0024796B9B|nr:uncharacterized protein LOC129753460 [Uranotaenia lowii]